MLIKKCKHFRSNANKEAKFQTNKQNFWSVCMHGV